jgi:hypothetical protein
MLQNPAGIHFDTTMKREFVEIYVSYEQIYSRIH